jgi:hypothetical protein
MAQLAVRRGAMRQAYSFAHTGALLKRREIEISLYL